MVVPNKTGSCKVGGHGNTEMAFTDYTLSSVSESGDCHEHQGPILENPNCREGLKFKARLQLCEDKVAHQWDTDSLTKVMMDRPYKVIAGHLSFSLFLHVGSCPSYSGVLALSLAHKEKDGPLLGLVGGSHWQSQDHCSQILGLQCLGSGVRGSSCSCLGEDILDLENGREPFRPQTSSEGQGE